MHPIKHVLPIQLCDNDPPFVFAYTTIKKFGISKTFFFMFLKSLILTKTAFTVMLWNIITSPNNRLLFYYIFRQNFHLPLNQTLILELMNKKF